MSRNVLLALVALLVVAVSYFTVLSPGGSGQSALEGGGGSAAETPSDGAELAATEAGPTGTEVESRRVAIERDGSPLESAAAPTLQVRVIPPDGAPQDDSLEVLALSWSVGPDAMIAAQDLDRIEDYDRQVGAFADFIPHAWRPESLRAAVEARAPLVSNGDGSLGASLEVGDEEKLWLMVAGTWLRSGEALEVELPREEPVTLDVALGVAVEVRVVDHEGQPAVDVPVRLGRGGVDAAGAMSGDDDLQVLQRTDVEGVALFRSLAPGQPWKVRIRPEGHAPEDRDVPPLEAGEQRVLEFALDPGARIAGFVRTPDGLPAGGARVIARKPGVAMGFDDETVRIATADAEGRFELVALAQGKLSVHADHDAWLQSKGTTVTLAHGERQTGVDLELREGRSVAGVAQLDDGSPAAGVEILATFDVAHMAGPSAMNFLTGREGRAVTDAGGRFEVRGLGAGPFVLRAEQAAGPEKGEPLRARADGVRPGTKDVVLTLRAPLVLRGRVVDDLGDAAPRVLVTALRVVKGALGPFDQDRRDTRADDEGEFRLEGLAAGAWELIVEDSTHVTLEPHPLELPGTEGDIVVVAPRAARVAGTVLGADGRPSGGAEVSVEALAGAIPGFSKRSSGASATAEEDGTFELEGVPPRSVALRASGDGGAPGTPVEVDLAPAEEQTGVVLQLAAGGSVTGEVFDEEGRPVAGRVVMLNRPDMTRGGQATTDGEGRFAFEHLEPGGYQVLAMDFDAIGDSAREGGDGSGPDMAGMFSNMQMAQVSVAEGETVHVVLGTVPDDPVRVVGEVTLGGEPFGGAAVSYFPAGEGLYESMKVAQVGADGRYEVVLPKPGDYVVAVQRLPGGPGQQSTIEYRASVPDVDEHTIDFEVPGGRIAGRVVGPDGEAASGARVSLAPMGGVRTDQLMGGNFAEIETGSDGRFEVVGLRAGTYRLSVGGAPFLGVGGASFGRVVREGLRLREDQSIDDLELRVPRAGRIAVKAVGPGGDAVAGASLFVRDEAGTPVEPFSFITTDAAGRAVCDGLAPGTYTVTARDATLASDASAPVRVEEGGTAEAEVTLTSGTLLRVELKVRGGGDVPPASVTVTGPDGHDMASLTSMNDLQRLYSEYEFSSTTLAVGPLAPGRYRIKAAGGGLDGSRSVTLRGEAERRISVVLK